MITTNRLFNLLSFLGWVVVLGVVLFVLRTNCSDNPDLFQYCHPQEEWHVLATSMLYSLLTSLAFYVGRWWVVARRRKV